MKGILLAGGRGTRLYPITRAMSKQLLLVYDKPMFYYPLSTLMEAGIHEILIITNTNDKQAFETLLGDGSSIGLHIEYAVQPFALGIADALRIGKDFIQNERVALILGDNLFIGQDFRPLLRDAASMQGAVIFTYPVDTPSSFGVAEIDQKGTVLSLIEKPKHPRSNLAVPGLYFYPPDAVERAQKLTPSARGELEITDMNRQYLQEGSLHAIAIHKNIVWLDTGTAEGLLHAINHVSEYQKKGYNPGCIEQTAARMGFIGKQELRRLAHHMHGSDYGLQILKADQEVSNV